MDESVVQQMEQVLDETVTEALEEQEKVLQKEIQKLSQKRDFWRHTAFTEFIILVSVIFTGFIPK